MQAVVVYLGPSGEYEYNSDNLRLIAQWDQLYSLVVDGQPAALFGSTQDRTRPKHSLIKVGCFTLIEIMVVLVGTVALAGTVIRHRQTDPARAGWLLAVGTTVLFITVIASLFDSIETNRARFMVEPLIYYLTVVGIAVSFPGFLRPSPQKNPNLDRGAAGDPGPGSALRGSPRSYWRQVRCRPARDRGSA